jgi:hypothetical protein
MRKPPPVKNHLSKTLVRSNQNGCIPIGKIEHGLVSDAGIGFGDVKNAIAIFA